jgi:hypothetical protein
VIRLAAVISQRHEPSLLCFVGYYASVLRLARLFRQYRKVNSANFAMRQFYEVWLKGLLGGSETYAACSFAGRTTSTGQRAWRITPSETLPSMTLLIPPWPRQPITIRSAPSSLAKATISRSTAPILR